MDQQLSGLETGNMQAMMQSAWSWGVCVCVCVCVPLAVKVYGPEAQANISQLAACLAIRSNFCKSHAVHFCSLRQVKPGPSQS